MSNKIRSMVRVVNRHGLLSKSVAMCALMSMTSGVLAQASAGADAGTLEEVVVTGIRGSLMDAVATKRNATAVVDAISAEDIGKFPDSDIGESLARVPGITVNRQFGQGQQVSIRGASNQLTLTTLNGQSVASTGWYDQQAIDRSFNYSLLPPEMIAGVDVYKSSQADLVEGGVGGTVNVKTRQPLDMDAGTVFLSAEATHGSVSEETDPAVSGLVSWKNDSETFGILAAYSRNDTSYVRNGNESIYDWDRTVSTNHFKQDREQEAYDIAVQFRPTDRIELAAHYMTLDLSADNANTTAFFFPGGTDCDQTNAAGTCVLETSNASNSPVARAYFQTFLRQASMKSETMDFSGSYEGDNFILSAQLGRTEATGGTDMTSLFAGRIGEIEDQYGTIDATGDITEINMPNANWVAGDMDPFQMDGKFIAQPNSDEEIYFQTDLEFKFDGVVSAIKTGVRYTDHKVKDRTFNITPNAVGQQIVDPTTMYDGNVDTGMDHISLPDADLDAMIAHSKASAGAKVEDRSGYGAIREKNFAAYVMATFEMDRLRGNVGVRYIQTDAETDYYMPISAADYANTLSTEKGDYNDFLPSLNIAYDLTDKVVLRGAASQVISRPNYVDMFGRSSITGYDDVSPTNQVVTTGNVELQPYKANQLDFGAEYYYGSGNLVSATLFYKQVDDFTVAGLTSGASIGLVDPVGGDNWTIANKENGQGGDIAGVELQIQHAFDNGFGIIANYTYADSSADKDNFADEMGVFSDSSKNTVNLVGYYENDVFSARAAYNWRSEYMIREEPGFYSNRMHEDFGTMDLSFSYQVTDSVGLSFDVVNVFEEDSVQYGVAPTGSDLRTDLQNGYPTWSYEGERYISMGVNARF